MLWITFISLLNLKKSFCIRKFFPDQQKILKYPKQVIRQKYIYIEINNVFVF